jgi:hypothetical protein
MYDPPKLDRNNVKGPEPEYVLGKGELRIQVPFPVTLLDEGEVYCSHCLHDFNVNTLDDVGKIQCPACGCCFFQSKKFLTFLGPTVYFNDNKVPAELVEYIPECKKMIKDIYSNFKFTENLRQILIGFVWSFFEWKRQLRNIPRRPTYSKPYKSITEYMEDTASSVSTDLYGNDLKKLK